MEERRKKVAQKKIEKILQVALDKYLLKNELLAKRKELSEQDIENKIKSFEKEQSTYEKKHNIRIENIDKRITQQEELCKSELSRLLEEEKAHILSLISDGDVDNKVIEKQLEKLNLDISVKMRKNIEKSINSITKEAYESANSSLCEAVEDFDISVPIMLSIPEIKELDDSRFASKLDSVEKKIEENLRELELLRENSTEDEKLEIERKISACELQKEAVADQFLQLGVYHPEFIKVENEGGGNAGKITGRIIGEAADLALLIWNPAGAAAGAAKEVTEAAKVVSTADKAKDAATIFRYIKNAATKASETSREVDKKKEKRYRLLI